jgi:7-cyano-7-deazaguanine reductase
MSDHQPGEFHALGQPVTQPSRQLDTFLCPQHVTVVRFTSNELTTYCPVTHQPDFYTVEFEYQPDRLCIESKSLKLFLWSYRDEHCFAEALASQMAEQIVAAIDPKRCKVTLHQNVRGGLQLTAVAEIVRKT